VQQLALLDFGQILVLTFVMIVIVAVLHALAICIQNVQLVRTGATFSRRQVIPVKLTSDLQTFGKTLVQIPEMVVILIVRYALVLQSPYVRFVE
jgi:hypothetical protein